MSTANPNTIRNEQYTPLNLTDEEIKARRKKLHEIVNKLYPNLKMITSQEYERIKYEYNSGNREVVPELLEKSLPTIFASVVYVYSKYDFSKLDFEDALNIAYAHVYDLITSPNKKALSDKRTQYFGVLSINIRLHLSRMYQKMLRHNVHLVVNDCAEITEIKEEFSVDDIFNKFKNEDIVKIIMQQVEKLRDMEQKVFKLAFVQRRGDLEISKTLEMSVPTVRYYKLKIKRFLQYKLSQNDIYQEDYLI